MKQNEEKTIDICVLLKIRKKETAVNHSQAHTHTITETMILISMCMQCGPFLAGHFMTVIEDLDRV